MAVSVNRRGIQPIHPFPARMAPEIALTEVSGLPSGSLVLDPMAGSGTVLRVAAEAGHRALGFDLDPLAVLMARVWTTPLDACELLDAAEDILAAAQHLGAESLSLPWMEADPETRAFVDFWFAREQRIDLARLSTVLQSAGGPVGDALRVALSRLIITKDRGASLARDVSHSRPHRVRTENDYPVVAEFRHSVQRLARLLCDEPPPGDVQMWPGDARRLTAVPTGSIDAVITSPPYLNAIDYMRGHRLALVWLGYDLRGLRSIRRESIGAERMAEANSTLYLAQQVRESAKQIAQLPIRYQRMVDRYTLDIWAVVGEAHRVLRPGGRAVLVVGNSCIRGVFVENATIVTAAAESAGFALVERKERELPPMQRYLPPPTGSDRSSLGKRMRTETVLTFVRPGIPVA